MAFCHTSAVGQTLDFLSPAQVCIGERVKLDNTSDAGYQNFEWDFCEGDLLEPIQSLTAALLTELNQAAGMRMAEDNGLYFGFTVDRSSNTLYRQDFGSSLSNAPTNYLIDLSADVTLSSPQGIALIKIGNSWYGFISNSGSNQVVRLNFGPSLANTPSAVEVDFGNHLGAPTEIEVVKDGANYFLLVANFNSNEIVAANLGPDITNNLPASFQATAIAGSNGLYGFSVKRYADGVWRGIISAYNSSTFTSIAFENGFDSPGTVTDLTNILPAMQNPVKLALASWGEENVLIALTLGGGIYRIHFQRGSLFDVVQSSDVLNNFSVGPSLALTLFYDKGNWKAFTFQISAHAIWVVSFNKSCNQITTQYYTGEKPPIISANSSMTFDVTLRAANDGSNENVTKAIEVRNETAVAADFASDGVCVASQVHFMLSGSFPIDQFNWTFGDNQVSTVPAPSHQYAAPGEYTVSLASTASNGCNNFIEKTIRVFDPPIASFDMPAGVVCTNNNFTFTNNTIDNFEGNLSYQWLVNNETASTERDLRFSFSTEGAKTVKLITSIPGCSDEHLENIPQVYSGPTVDFTFENACQESEIDFTNLTSGTVLEFTWEFNDGSTVTSTNASKYYGQYGDFEVSLNATNDVGCRNTTTKTVSIHSLPQPSFSISSPPGSCTNNPTPFVNTSTNADSEIIEWNWEFGDANSSTANDPTPAFIYTDAKDYAVSLRATTAFGCEQTVQKTITIAASPSADFTHTPFCIDKPVTFSSLGTGIQSYFWTTGTVYYEINNPVHTYHAAGSYTMELSVVGNNGCIAHTSQPVFVPQRMTPDFSFTKNCVNTDIEFTDISSGPEQIASQEWDFGNGKTALGQSASFKFTSTGQDAVILKITTASGCSYSINKSVPVLSLPVASFSASPETGAIPLDVRFQNTSSGATVYSWRFGDTDVTSIEPSPEHVFNSLGSFTAELTAKNNAGCEHSVSKTITTLEPLPDVALDYLTTVENSDGTLKVIITLRNKGNTVIHDLPVHLDFSGRVALRETIKGPIEPAMPYNLVLSYTLEKLGLGYLCATSFLENDIAADNNVYCLNLEKTVQLFSAYPNPASENLTIEWISASEDNVALSLYDRWGNQVFENETISSKGLNQHVLDVSSFSDGLFVLVIKTPEKIKTQKIFILKH